MKKIIRLTESDLARLIKRMIKENEQDWIDQAQDMDTESDFSKMDIPQELVDNPDFQKLVNILKRNPEEAEELSQELEGGLNESHKYYDYTDAKPKEISRKQYWKRKLINYGLTAAVGALLGACMTGFSADDVLQMALSMAIGSSAVFGSLTTNVGREKVKESGLYEQDEEWGETDKGEQILQDLLEDARDFLENECGYDIEELNQMSEQDIVDTLYDEGNDGLAEEIEDLLSEEGFDTEKEFNENWDDHSTRSKFDKYNRMDYRKVPKNPIKPGAFLDYEGTRLSSKLDDDDDDFDEWGLEGDEDYV